MITFWWLFGTTLGGFVSWAVIRAIRLTLKARLERRLRSPEIDGVPLPAVDDPRWVHEKTESILGKFTVDEDYLYESLAKTHAIYLNGKRLGYWDEYGKRFRAHLPQLEKERLQLAALEEIENAK